MLVPSLLFLLMLAINVVIHYLSKVLCREEESLRIADGTLIMKSQASHMPIAAWILSVLFLVITLMAPIKSDTSTTACMAMGCLSSLFLCVITYFLRQKYYTIDDKRLTCVKNHQVEWSQTWEEIDHAHRRIISTGKTFFILYDITTKDGVKHRSLPSILGRDLKEHVRMDKRVPRKLKLIVGVTLLVVIIALVYMKMAQ